MEPWGLGRVAGRTGGEAAGPGARPQAGTGPAGPAPPGEAGQGFGRGASRNREQREPVTRQSGFDKKGKENFAN